MKPSEENLRKELALEIPGAGHINYSVKAGAGGGKTTMFSIRICAQIREGLPIDRFVIITYTNAAAAELREKITEHLAELLAEGTLSGDEREHVQTALDNIELMQISTIHSFLLKILKEYSFEAGVVMDVQMLEDVDESARKDAFFHDWYRRNYDDFKAFAPDWTMTLKSTQQEKDFTHDVFHNMFCDMANVRDEVVYDTTDHTAELQQEAEDYVRAWIKKLVIFKNDLMANRPIAKTTGAPYKMIGTTESIVSTISTAEGKTNYNIADAIELSAALQTMKKILDKGDSFYGGRADNTALAGSIPDLPKWEPDWNFQLYYEKYVQPAQKASKVAEYVIKMQQEYQKGIDAETKVISNDEILYRAEQLLKNHSDVLDALRLRYDKIYVDEFQDTTGLQMRVLKMLAEKTETDPADEKLEADKLMIVGDPKQSIYRFTGAEKTVYDRMDGMLDALPATEAQSVSLDTNFRSNKDIVDWVNRSFDRLMPSSYSPMDTDWVTNEANALHGVYRYVSDMEKYGKADDIEAVVELVRELVDDDAKFLEEYDRKEETYHLRKIQYSDIMIICKNTGNMSGYVKRFAELGIPVNIQGRYRIDDDEVLRNFVLLVEYFANTKNKKNRVTADQILGGFDATEADQSERTKMEDRLRDIWKLFKEEQLDTAAKVRYLESREELFLPQRGIIPTERVRSYRTRLYQMVETCLLKNTGGWKELSILMRQYLETDVRREIPLENNENAVRLMNAHQSKGLTGQIVIIADRSNDENCRYGDFRKEGKYYPAVKYSRSGHRSESIPAYGYDKNILKTAYEDETEEAIRLQYVAATRAAHALIIMPAISSKSWFTAKEYHYDSLPDINEWLEMREEDKTEYHPASSGTGDAHTIETLAELADNGSTADFVAMEKPQLTSITPSGLEPSGTTGYNPSDPGYAKESRPSAYVFGTVMHRAFELVALHYEKLVTLPKADREKRIERFLNQAILEQTEELRMADKPDEFVAFLKPIVLRYLDTVFAPIMESAAEVYPEYAFSFYVADSERAAFLAEFTGYLVSAKIDITDEPIWINGKADLVVKQKDGQVKVYDYKSDERNGKPLADFEQSLETKYAGQIALYRYAIGKSFNVPEVETKLIHLYK